MYAGLAVLVLGILVSACAPVPVVFPPHVELLYHGAAPHEPGYTCQNRIPFLWITGPEDVRMKLIAPLNDDGTATLRVEVLSRRGLPLRVAKYELIADNYTAEGPPAIPLDFIESHLIPLAPGPGRSPAIGETIVEARLGRVSETGMNAILPIINIGSNYTGHAQLDLDQPVAVTWTPGAVHLRLVTAPWGFLPFNC